MKNAAKLIFKALGASLSEIIIIKLGRLIIRLALVELAAFSDPFLVQARPYYTRLPVRDIFQNGFPARFEH